MNQWDKLFVSVSKEATIVVPIIIRCWIIRNKKIKTFLVNNRFPRRVFFYILKPYGNSTERRQICCCLIKSNKFKEIISTLPPKYCTEIVLKTSENRCNGLDILIGTDLENECFGTLNNVWIRMDIKIVVKFAPFDPKFRHAILEIIYS